MKKYEIAYIVHPDLENTLDKVTDKVNTFVSTNGQVLNEDVWGKKRLAYPIAKQNYGIYVILTANLSPLAVTELENLLKITEEVIRFLVIGLNSEVVLGKEKFSKMKTINKETEKEVLELTIDKKEVVEEAEEKPKKPEEKLEKKSKKKVEKEVSEEERLEELDKKLKQILGEEN